MKVKFTLENQIDDSQLCEIVLSSDLDVSYPALYLELPDGSMVELDHDDFFQAVKSLKKLFKKFFKKKI